VRPCTPLKIAVIGAGVAGCTVAFELSKQGFNVTLLDESTPGLKGASGGPVALLNPYRGRSGRASSQDLVSLNVFWKLCSDLTQQGFNPGATKSGILRIAHNTRQAKNWHKLPAVSWLNPEDIPYPYNSRYGGFIVNDGGWLQPNKFLIALVKGATAYGTHTRFNNKARTISGRVGEFLIRTAQGSLLVDRIVLCTGAGKIPNLDTPKLQLLAGDVIGLSPTPKLPFPIAGAVYGATLKNKAFIGGNHRPVGKYDQSIAESLRTSFSWFVPDLQVASVRSVWTGVRAKRPNNVPLLTELQPGLWFLGALAGRGFLASAWLAKKLASYLYSAPDRKSDD
tara:strand:+ start:678 stop:1691 length:1014 start_codon:yes stop_codon:yes gene_type:complete